ARADVPGIEPVSANVAFGRLHWWFLNRSGDKTPARIAARFRENCFYVGFIFGDAAPSSGRVKHGFRLFWLRWRGCTCLTGRSRSMQVCREVVSQEWPLVKASIIARTSFPVAIAMGDFFKAPARQKMEEIKPRWSRRKKRKRRKLYV